MVKFSAVQGRFSSMVADKYQHFPIHNWRNEFNLARSMGFDGIEWIVSDFSNPIFDPQTRLEIIKICRKTGIEITSISLDVLMQKTLNRFSDEEIHWLFHHISLIAADVGLQRVSIPIEETSGIKDEKTMLQVKTKLQMINFNYRCKPFSLAIETDLKPSAIGDLLREKTLEELGVLVDIGNAAANGFRLQEYFKILSKKIYSLHIKDRMNKGGISVPLGDGFAEFNFLTKNIEKLTNLKDIVIQAYRSKENYESDLQNAKKFLQNILLNKSNYIKLN